MSWKDFCSAGSGSAASERGSGLSALRDGGEEEVAEAAAEADEGEEAAA